MLFDALASALLNVVLLAAIPFGAYAAWGRWRRGRSLGESAARAGLAVGDRRLLGWSALVALATGAAVALVRPDLEAMTREGSAWAEFAGLGLSGTSVAMALLYGVVKTGFAEELLFRGLIAGSLGRRMRRGRANLLQAAIFLAPHVPLVLLLPEAAWLLGPIFLGALLVGWIRLRSGSIAGPWLIHAAVNVAMALSVAARTAS